jgi:hypothetical protein
VLLDLDEVVGEEGPGGDAHSAINAVIWIQQGSVASAARFSGGAHSGRELPQALFEAGGEVRVDGRVSFGIAARGLGSRLAGFADAERVI